MDWPFLVALACFLVAFALYGYRARPQSSVNRWFALQTLALALWVTGIAGTHAGYFPEFWGRWTFASASLMPPTFLGFTCAFPENSRPRPERLLRIIVGFGLCFSALSAFSPLVAHSFVLTPSGLLRRQAGPLMPLFTAFIVVSAVLVLGVLVVKWRRAAGQARAHLRFYNTGLSVFSAGAITTNLLLPTLTGHSEYSTFGPYFVLPLVGLIGHAIVRHRLFDLQLLLHRGVAFLVLIALTSAAILTAVKQTGIEQPLALLRLPFEALVVLFVAAAALSLPVAPRIARIMDSYFLRSRPDLDRALQEASRRLTRGLTTDGIATELESVLKSTLAIDSAIVLTHDSDARGLSADVCAAAWELRHPAPSLLLLSREQVGPGEAKLTELLRTSGFEVWVCLGRAAQRTAVILLGPMRAGEAYLASTLSFIEGVAELSSMAFEVAVLHRRHIDLERERHRLEHLARMGRAYAGLGHEIRTPLTTISNLVSLIPDRLEDPEFRDVLTRLIPGEVARIVKLTERLRMMAPGDGARMAPVFIERIVSDLVTMHTLAERDVTMAVDAADDLPPVRGDASQLVQLFTNLINNAFEALNEGGSVVIRLMIARSNDGRTVLRSEVLDDGPGIPDDVADRLFEPFFTTKPTGTGLGLSICREIADFHDAVLTVRRRTDSRGTAAVVEFPVPEELLRSSAEHGAGRDTERWERRITLS